MTFLLKSSAINIKQVQTTTNKPYKYGAYLACIIIVYLLYKSLFDGGSNEFLTSSTHVLDKDADIAKPRDPTCSYWDCFNVYRCGSQQRMLVYVYPNVRDFVDQNGNKADKFTKEFYVILQTIIKSRYYTTNPNEACIFIPSIDTLSQANINVELVSKALAALP